MGVEGLIVTPDLECHDARMRKAISFFKTPKGLLTILLVVLTAIAAPGEGVRVVLINMGAAVLAAGIADAIFLRVRDGTWDYPSGAVLTAMIVAMVVRAQEPWYVATITSVVAVLSKYVLRTRQANVFNPAAFALVLVFYVLPTGQSWWGALPEVTPLWLRGVLLLGGIYIANRVNKLPLVLSFLGRLFLPVHGHRVPRRCPSRRRDFPLARHRCGDLLHARHPDRPADLARQVRGPVDLRAAVRSECATPCSCCSASSTSCSPAC